MTTTQRKTTLRTRYRKALKSLDEQTDNSLEFMNQRDTATLNAELFARENAKLLERVRVADRRTDAAQECADEHAANVILLREELQTVKTERDAALVKYDRAAFDLSTEQQLINVAWRALLGAVASDTIKKHLERGGHPQHFLRTIDLVIRDLHTQRARVAELREINTLLALVDPDRGLR